MKKIFYCLAGLLAVQNIWAQEPADALRFSWYIPGASARIRAVGGAMGSLGGDITATFVNPAGLAFYRTGDVLFSPTYTRGKTRASYLSGEEEKTSGKLTWGTTGLVFGGSNSSGNRLRSGAFSIAYNRTADFNSRVYYRGINNQSSFSERFLEEIRNNNERNAHTIAIGTGNYRYGAALALNTAWIDTAAGGSPGNYDFISLAPVGTGLIQENDIHTSGGIDEFAFGLAVSLEDKLMIGGTLGIPVLHYRSEKIFVESDASGDPANRFSYARFTEKLRTSGAGLNLKAGVIYKPREFWRLGLAVHSPTFFSLTDRFSSSLTTDTENFLGVISSSSDDPEYLDDYGESRFTYQLITPYRVIGSVSYVIRETQDITRQRGFLTADVEFVNYRASSFHPDDENSSDAGTREYLRSLNRAIDQAYRNAFNFRAGGELKFTILMFRAGFAYYGNPYRNINGEKGNLMSLSGGLGYRHKGFFTDLTYVHALSRDMHFPYRLQHSPYYGATIRSAMGSLFATVGFKF